MRITGGDFCRRKLDVPDAYVRPASDRVREAVFSMLAEVIPGCRALDLFAGSGAYGLEAVSRGAEKVLWVEKNPQVITVLKKNVSTLCGEPMAAHVIQRNVWEWLEQGKRPQSASGYNLIFADPPYDPEGTQDQLTKMLNALGDTEMLAEKAILVFEQSKNEQVVTQYKQWQLLRNKKYGKSRILIYKK